MDIPQTRFLEELSANAWPPEVIQIVDGWRLRFTQGVTRRANSVWPNNASGKTLLDEKLALVEAFYGQFHLPARFKICPACLPADLDEVLAARAYTMDAPTAVQIASLNAALARPQSQHAVSVSQTLTDEWFDIYCQSEGFSEERAVVIRAIQQRIAPRTGFAMLMVGGKPVAIGLGVLERGWLGVFSMSTHPAYRRQGCATAVLYALAEWGRAYGAVHIYLQVMDRNAPARALYAQAGFKTVYKYWYREQGGQEASE